MEGHLWLTDVRFNLELTLHTVNQDIQVWLTHAGHDGLTSFLLSVWMRRWIFLIKRRRANAIFTAFDFGSTAIGYQVLGTRYFPGQSGALDQSRCYQYQCSSNQPPQRCHQQQSYRFSACRRIRIGYDRRALVASRGIQDVATRVQNT